MRWKNAMRCGQIEWSDRLEILQLKSETAKPLAKDHLQANQSEGAPGCISALYGCGGFYVRVITCYTSAHPTSWVYLTRVL